jgi:hypothetical protein
VNCVSQPRPLRADRYDLYSRRCGSRRMAGCARSCIGLAAVLQRQAGAQPNRELSKPVAGSGSAATLSRGGIGVEGEKQIETLRPKEVELAATELCAQPNH